LNLLVAQFRQSAWTFQEIAMGHCHLSRFGVGLLLAAGVNGAAQAVPMSNQDFAAQVRAWRGQMAASESVLGQAALLCTNLPSHRAVEEPQCVALRLHLRSRAQAQAQVQGAPGAGAETLSGCARSALSGMLGGLTALVGSAA
jgi:hypothetical protein